jgi:SAM-dependent methyltransferase
MNCVDREESVITKKGNLEHLQTIKNYPVFFGCTDKPKEEDIKADMVWKIDTETGIVQLSKLIPLDILYMEQHVDAIGKTWTNHNNNFSDYVLKNKIGNIIEIGGGSGKIANIILDKDKDITYTAIEPNPLFDETDRLKVIKSFFNGKLKNKFDKNNTIIFSQLYEHIYEPEEFLNEINEFLPVGGRLVFAYPNLEYWFKNKFTNAINFEHTMLMTDYFVDYFLSKTGFKIIEKYDYENHSHFYTAEKVEENLEFKLDNKYEHYKNMFNDFVSYHEKIVNEINETIKNKKEVYLFGGHIFSQHLIMCGLDTSNIVNILDNSTLKQEKRLYGTDLMVESPKVLKDIDNPIVILKAGLYEEEIKKDILENINNKTKFI